MRGYPSRKLIVEVTRTESGEFSMRGYPSRKLIVEVTRTESGVPMLRLWEKRARKSKVEIPLETVYLRLLGGATR